MDKDTGGPAFPSADMLNRRGMTLRDWFAGQALASIPLRQWGDPPPPDIISLWAKASYLLADAMLKERSK